jgi:ribose transport system permease protein
MSTTATTAQKKNSLVDRIAARLLVDPTLGVLALLILICLVSAFTLPVFLEGSNLYNLLNTSLVVMILAMGMTVVLISGGIDLSIGTTMALCAGVAATAMKFGLPLFAALIAALATGALVGIGNGLLITRLGLPDFIATLAMLGFASGILYIWTKGVPIIGYMVPEFYVIGGLTPLLGSLTLPMIIALLVALVLGGILGSTRLGTYFFAVGSSKTGAIQSGIRVDRVKTQAYIISGLSAGVAGIVMAGRNTNVPADLGNGYEIQAIAAAVIGGAALSGGRGRILGAILGAVNLINLVGVPSSYQKIVIGAILILAVLANRISAIVSGIVRQRRALILEGIPA